MIVPRITEFVSHVDHAASWSVIDFVTKRLKGQDHMA